MRIEPVAAAGLAGLIVTLGLAPAPSHVVLARKHVLARHGAVATPTPCTIKSGFDTFTPFSDQNNIPGAPEAGTIAGTNLQACGDYSVVTGGLNNATDSFSSFIGDGVMNESTHADNSGIVAGNYNTTTGIQSFIGAGSSNNAAGRGSVVVGGDTLYFDTFMSANDSAPGSDGNVAQGVDSFVGAGDLNQVTGAGSFIGAGGWTYAEGGAESAGNQIAATDSFIGAGDQNSITASQAFIGGGALNAIQNTGGAAGGQYAFVGGGYQNSIQPYAKGGGEYGVLAGGADNIVYGVAATIGGGVNNRANGEYATIPGGRNNNANGVGSFAAGTGARAIGNGTFVWSDDASTASLQASGNYQFLARASGGYYLYSNAAANVGVKLAPGSGAWASLSDRAAKTRVRPLDDADVLAKVAALPVESWQYRSEDARVRHVGPMAQDFYAAFGVGEDDRHITSIDEDGVALAAIKALHTENMALRARLAGQGNRIARQDARVAALEKGLRELSARLSGTTH
jgi:hypothetical protein